MFKGRMTKADVYQYETNPEHYLAQRRAIRNRNIEEVVGCIALVEILFATFTFWMVAEGIW